MLSLDPMLIAKVCYEVYRIDCEGNGTGIQPTWVGATQLEKDLIINEVKYHIEHPNDKPFSELSYKEKLFRQIVRSLSNLSD